jgi:hypothetical protein
MAAEADQTVGTALQASGLLDVVMEIGRERSKIHVAMKEALLSGDDEEALELARELTGLPSKRRTT